MDQLKGLPLGRQLILGAGVLLLIDTFLDWQQVSFLGHSAGQSAWHGFWGIIMGLALIALLAWTIARAFEITHPVNAPDGITSLSLTILILLFALIKALTDDAVHWPAWLGVILAAVMTYGAWLVYSASGESLPSVGSMGGSSSGSAGGSGSSGGSADTTADE
jgi:uncharacterized membrane protein YgcG